MADWSMEPAADCVPCDLELASWTMDPAVSVPSYPVEFASTDVFSSCDQVSISVFDGELQEGYEEEVATHYYPIETTTKKCVARCQNMEIPDNEEEVITNVLELHEADITLKDKKMYKYPARIRRALHLKCEYTTPTVVAIGPYFHCQNNLLQVEEMKHLAAIECTMMSNSDKALEEIYEKIVPVAHKARGLYNQHVMARICPEDFLHMMFFDACFLVQYMRFNSGYYPDMNESLCRFFQSNNEAIFYDIMLLQNQIPWPLVAVVRGFVRVRLKRFIDKFLDCLKDRKEQPNEMDQPDHKDPPGGPPLVPHLLGLFRFHIVGRRSKTQRENNSNPEYPDKKNISFSVSATELAEMGIEVKANENSDLIDMGFRMNWPVFGELFLAPVSLNEARASLLVSMASLEMCRTSNFKEAQEEDSAVCSYLLLLALLASTEEDVKMLRKQHVLQGAGFTDSEVLDFFKTVRCLRLGKCYVRTMEQIEVYKCERPCHKCYAWWYRNYKTICTVAVFCGGLVALLGTIFGGLQLRSK